jgi:two-component system sensor kinase FixL
VSVRSDGDEDGPLDGAPPGDADSPASPQLVREQAATIAHYKKMYDRSSALARIGVWEYDLVTDTMTWTDGVYDLFELPRGLPLSRPEILKLYHDDSRREMEQLREQALAAGGRFGLDIRIRTALGNDRWLHLTADVEQQDGRSVRIFGTKQDVTEARSAQERVKALQAELIHVSRKSAMGAMAATLAHELNQPLAAISNYVAGTRRALEGPAPDKDKLVRGLDSIEETALRAGAIIRSLRHIVDGSAIVRQPLDPSRLIREAAALALAGGSDGVALDLRLAENLIVQVDPVQFEQVMINLIRNAAEAVESAVRREIVIATSTADDEAEIRVEDSGPGIALDRLPTLFETFASTKAGGMGVGLAISRTIVEAHGGRIVVGNREGGGAVFRITLPLAVSAVAPAARPDQPGSRALGKPPQAES